MRCNSGLLAGARRRQAFKLAKSELGQKGDLMVLKFDFRSTTRSGLQSDVAACPKGARRRHSFNHFIGAQSEAGRDLNADFFCGFHIYDEFELGRLYDGKVGRFRSFQNFSDVNAGLAICLDDAGAETDMQTMCQALDGASLEQVRSRHRSVSRPARRRSNTDISSCWAG